ncbi:alpha/beta hydrolase, partial [Bacillus sp. S34]|nr:alpha/beta hydrolase [Bacillus sp. S34]
LMAAGSEDGIRDSAVRLAAAAPNASFFEIPRRNHFNAPTSRDFREAAITFLSAAR